MRNTTLLLLLLASSLLVSCVLFADQIYSFDFTNNTDESIGLIVDFSPKDNTITKGSYYVKEIIPGKKVSVDNDDSWDRMVKDSMHFYIVKVIPNLSEKKQQSQLSQTDIERIAEEDIYARITYTKKRFKETWEFCFPPPKGTKIVYYPAYSNAKK